jgi:hypothetical protein
MTSAAAGSYSFASSAVSEAIYGTQPGYGEAAQSSISAAFSTAQDAISIAIYGTPTGPVESVTSAAASAAGEAYTSVSFVVVENVAAVGSVAGSAYLGVAAKASGVIYGPEQGAMESASFWSRSVSAFPSFLRQ